MVGELNCRPGAAMLQTSGAALEVSGLDGSAVLQSRGGPMQVITGPVSPVSMQYPLFLRAEATDKVFLGGF